VCWAAHCLAYVPLQTMDRHHCYAVIIVYTGMLLEAASCCRQPPHLLNVGAAPSGLLQPTCNSQSGVA
jgi:hypothetical protein